MLDLEALAADCQPLEGTRLLLGLRQIGRMAAADLASSSILSSVIRDIGLTRAVGLYGSEESHMLYNRTCYQPLRLTCHQGQNGIGQLPEQFAGALATLATLGIRSFIEVGTASGWTATIVAALLRKSAGETEQVISTSLDVGDIRTRCTRHVQAAIGHGFGLVPLRIARGHPSNGSTAHADFMRGEVARLVGVGGVVDLCFIDADHSFAGVQQVGCHNYAVPPRATVLACMPTAPCARSCARVDTRRVPARTVS